MHPKHNDRTLLLIANIDADVHVSE